MSRLNLLNKKSKVLIATFSPWKNGKRLPTNGMVEPFVDFFSKKFGKLDLIDQPHPGSDIVLPIIEEYKNGKSINTFKNSILIKCFVPLLKFTNVHKTQISFKLRDFVSVLDFVFRNNTKYDLFIGFESINALAGIILKKFGRINKVVYYVSDFSPNRYSIKWFNSLYLLLDKLATTYADATWNVSMAMSDVRKKLGYDMSKVSQQILAPNAFFKNQIKSLPFSKVLPFSVVYAGSMGLENGPDLAIKSVAKLIKKYPKLILTMIGGGNKKEQEKLKKLIAKLQIEKNINYIGFVQTNEEMYQIVRKHMFSIAPYKAIPNSVRWYADAVKIRTSLACGLPVITTQVPPNGKLVSEAKAGIITRDNVNDLVDAMITLFSNKKLYLQMRRNAILSAKENTWENSYSNALKEMDLIE
mgnify:CR=1 FL=1